VQRPHVLGRKGGKCGHMSSQSVAGLVGVGQLQHGAVRSAHGEGRGAHAEGGGEGRAHLKCTPPDGAERA
jgi:hypothetical protein